MSKHTPGPWIVAHRVQVQDKKLGGGIALCNRYAPYDEVDQANANLIAAAPDLLALLDEARRTLEMWKDVAPAVSLCADIDKAIAKAKGGK